MILKKIKQCCYVMTGLMVVLLLPLTVWAQEYIADYKVARESVLRGIPVRFIEAAKSNLHIMYCGTSHSSQTVDGMRGLMQYKTGDNTLFAVTFNGVPVAGSLDIHYRPSGPYTASDLSHDSVDAQGKTQYYYRTIEYLDNPAYADVNVVMWSWCSIDGHDVQVYLDNFQALINMYRAGGSKGRTAANAVRFVFMTGYASGGYGDTPEPPYIHSPYQNHKRIVDFCKANGYFCLDYWSQDTYEYETDAYKPTEDGNDNVQHKAYTDSHTVGVDWFQCRDYGSGSVSLPAHANQHLTGNRRAYGAWWIWARLAGWNGSEETPHPDINSDSKVDIVWRYTNTANPGWNMAWCMNGTAKLGGNTWLPRIADPDWEIDGTGDFNHDGKTDLLLRYYGTNGGWNMVWFMNGENKTGQAVLPRVPDLDWKIETTGDFNNDGHTDILWRYYGAGGGWNMIWLMNGATKTSTVNIPRITDLDWQFVGTGDFNNDGHIDILMRYYGAGGGWNIVWFMNGTTKTGSATLPRLADVDWKIVGTGDFNNDGKIDILWRYTAAGGGWNMAWIMNGTSKTRDESITAFRDMEWKVVN